MPPPFKLIWTDQAAATFNQLQADAIRQKTSREKTRKRKTTRKEGLFQQAVKCLSLLEVNPRHPGLRTHEFSSIEHPYENGGKVFEAYVQNNTPGAYRMFWCYGPEKGQLTIIAITPHP